MNIGSRLQDLSRVYTAHAQRAYRYGEDNLLAIILIGVLANLLFYPIDLLTLDPTYDTFYIRLGSSVAGLPLVLAAYFRHASAPLLYWLAATGMVYAFCIAFLFNAASVDHLGALSPGWMAAYVVTLFLYIIGMNSPLLSLSGWAVTVPAALATVYLLDDANWTVVHSVFTSLLGIYATAVVMGSILLNRFDLVAREKTKAARAIGENVAHELRTPITGISFRLAGAGKKVAQAQSHLSADASADALLGDAQELLTQTREEVEQANTIIEMLLVNTAREGPAQSQERQGSAAQMVAEALRRFPFTNLRERGLVSMLVEEDFVYCGPQLLLVHVLFNLLKNALYFVQQDTRDPRVEVTVAARRISVFDNGPGIAARDLSRVFDRFYTTAPVGRGSGIGLAFCRQVMRTLGGDIECDSVAGEYTRFDLVFPPLNPSATQLHEMPSA